MFFKNPADYTIIYNDVYKLLSFHPHFRKMSRRQKIIVLDYLKNLFNGDIYNWFKSRVYIWAFKLMFYRGCNRTEKIKWVAKRIDRIVSKAKEGIIYLGTDLNKGRFKMSDYLMRRGIEVVIHNDERIVSVSDLFANFLRLNWNESFSNVYKEAHNC